MVSRYTRATFVVLFAFVACQGSDAGSDAADTPSPADAQPATEMMSAAPPEGASVTIVSPADGAAFDAGDVTVTLQVSGIQIQPAGTLIEGTAHHHLFLDTDITPPHQAIPASMDQIVHLGTGASEHTFTGLAPGQHRLIAVLADGLHFPFDPALTDTVEFTVGG